MQVKLTVNGVAHTADAEPRTLLVHLLRDNLGLTGTHVGCDSSSCGACTVILDGDAVKSCTILAAQADGAAITTVEGVGAPDALHPVQAGFRAEHGLQCGYCTPGFIMATIGFLEANPSPSVEDVKYGLDGNLCRCTGYVNIVRAVLHAAALARGENPEPVAGTALTEPLLVTDVTSGPAQEDLGGVSGI